MFKFLVMRLEEPSTPTWALRSPEWEGADAKCLSVWRWMLGAADPEPTRTGIASNRGDGRDRGATIAALLERMEAPGPDETARLEAAYSLGAIGAPAVGPLLQALRRQVEANLEHVTWAQTFDLKAKARANRAGAQTNPAQVHARAALVAVGGPAVAPLAALVRGEGTASGGWALRAAAADCLGDIGRRAGADSAEGAVAALISALTPACGDGEAPSEGEQWVVRNATEALGLIGTAAAAALPALAALAVARPAVEGWAVPSWIRHNAVIAIGRIVSRLVPALALAHLPAERC